MLLSENWILKYADGFKNCNCKESLKPNDLYDGGGGCNPKKNRKKPVPNLKFVVAFGFFRFFFSGIFRLFSVFFGFFSVFFGIFRFFVVLFRFFSV